MSTAAISGLIGALAATLIASYFGNRPAEISVQTGRRRLYYAVGLRALTDFIVIVLALLTVATMFRQPDDFVLHIVMTMFTLLAGGLLIIETHFSSIEYDNDGIFVNSPWQRKRTIPWSDVESIHRRTIFSMHTIYTMSGDRVFVQDAMSGSSEFVEHCKWQARRNEFG